MRTTRFLAALAMLMLVFVGCSSDEDPPDLPDGTDSTAATGDPAGRRYPVKYSIWNDTKEVPLQGETQVIVDGEEPWTPTFHKVKGSTFADSERIGKVLYGSTLQLVVLPDGPDGESVEAEIFFPETAAAPKEGKALDVVIYIKDDFVRVNSFWVDFDDRYPRF